TAISTTAISTTAITASATASVSASISAAAIPITADTGGNTGIDTGFRPSPFYTTPISPGPRPPPSPPTPPRPTPPPRPIPSPTPAPQDPIAHIRVIVPADAEVWFGQGKTKQTGAVREFVSPALTPGKDFVYEVKARWMKGDKEVVETRLIDVAAGVWKSVD